MRLTSHAGEGRLAFMPYAIDTAATIADLESAGVEPSQAKAIVRAINGAAGDPVSKEDFKELRSEFKALEGKFAELREEMDRRFAELRDEMDRKFATKADLAILKNQLTTRTIVSQIATATLLFMLLKFFA